MLRFSHSFEQINGCKTVATSSTVTRSLPAEVYYGEFTVPLALPYYNHYDRSRAIAPLLKSIFFSKCLRLVPLRL